MEEERSVCSYCGTQLEEGADKCPRCGTMVGTVQETQAPMASVITPNEKGSNNSTLKWVIAGVALLLVVVIAVYVNNNVLFGDDKIAYELVLGVADWFKDPSSVRLAGGELGTDKDCLFANISAKNGFGTRGTQAYYISSSGWMTKADEYYSFYYSTDELNLEKINRALEKKLKSIYGD